MSTNIDLSSVDSESPYVAAPIINVPPPPVYISGVAQVGNDAYVYDQGRIQYLLAQSQNLQVPAPPVVNAAPAAVDDTSCCTPARIKNAFYGGMTGLGLGWISGLSFVSTLGLGGLCCTLTSLCCADLDCDTTPVAARRAP